MSDQLSLPAAGDVHPSCLSDADLLLSCEIRRGRASGPGGQHRNKVETAVSIQHLPTGIIGAATEQRSQNANRKVAIRRLRIALAVEHRTVASATVEPSSLWSSRCRSGKISCNAQHQDFPALLAEAMNAIFAKDFDVRIAAAALGCSSSQLIRFLAKAPEALEKVNREREQQGLRRLHG